MQEPKFFKIVISSFLLISLMTGCDKPYDKNIGQTKVSKWKGNKKAAISITYDDGIISQFTVARPIMNKLNLPATFFVLTGKIEGSLLMAIALITWVLLSVIAPLTNIELAVGMVPSVV